MNEYSTCVVGIDPGDRTSIACVYRPGVVAMTPAGGRAAFEGKAFRAVALEAGAQSGWVTRELQALGHKPNVANPRKLKAISANERKSDRGLDSPLRLHRSTRMISAATGGSPSSSMGPAGTLLRMLSCRTV